jgi:hypothetical protein
LPANFAARATPSKRRVPRSTGRSRASRSIASSIASIAKTPRRKPWLGVSKEHEIDLFGHVADVWVTSRDRWQS